VEEVGKKCSHCHAKEGYKRPIGRYIVELHEFDFEGEKLQLCITCYKHFQRKVVRHSIEDEKKENHSFYSNLMKFYKKKVSSGKKQRLAK